MDSVTGEITLDERNIPRSGAQPSVQHSIGERSNQMPGMARVVIVSEVVINRVSLRHQQLEVTACAVRPLDQLRVAGYPSYGYAARNYRKRSVPIARLAVQGPVVEIFRLRSDGRLYAHDELVVAMAAVAEEGALNHRHADRLGTQMRGQ